MIKCYSNYKTWLLLQNASVQLFYKRSKVYFRRRDVLRHARTFSSSKAQSMYKTIFLGVLGRAVPNVFERSAARLSTALARRLKWKGVLLVYYFSVN